MFYRQRVFKTLQRTSTIKKLPIAHVRSDHGREFDQLDFDSFCTKYDISHNLSAPRIPQQNRVMKCKNHTLENMFRTMLLENDLHKTIWA